MASDFANDSERQRLSAVVLPLSPFFFLRSSVPPFLHLPDFPVSPVSASLQCYAMSPQEFKAINQKFGSNFRSYDELARCKKTHMSLKGTKTLKIRPQKLRGIVS